MTDVLGVLCQLFSYVRAQRIYEGVSATAGEWNERFKEYLTFAQSSKAIKMMRDIADMGYTEREVRDYDEFRFHHHTVIANYLRTVSLDFATGSSHQDSQQFVDGLKDAKAFLAMLDENSKWTKVGIEYGMISAIRYEWKSEKPSEEVFLPLHII